MSTIHEWAKRWNVPLEAIHELRDTLAPPSASDDILIPSSEAAVKANACLEASRLGCRLWRNQVGGMYDEAGRFVRFGLANESEQMNAKIKSADLIGIRPVLIGPSDVGRTIGQFMSVECKPRDWNYKGDEHEIAQMAWATLITTLGGDARFCNGRNPL